MGSGTRFGFAEPSVDSDGYAYETESCPAEYHTGPFTPEYYSYYRYPNSRNPRHFNIIEGGRVHQALHIDSKSALYALCRVKKCLRPSM